MVLVRYVSPIVRWARMDSLLDSLFTPGLGAATIREDEAATWVRLPLAGYRPDEVDLSVEGHQLSVHAHSEGNDDGWREERSYARIFILPEGVDAAGTTAALENGLLTVRLPRREDAKPVKIAVTGSARQIMASDAPAISAGQAMSGGLDSA